MRKQPEGRPVELIDIDQPYEVRYWALRLRVTPQRLIEAVGAVGLAAADIEEWLNNRRAAPIELD